MRDTHYTPFQRSPSEHRRPEAVTVFVMAHLRGDLATHQDALAIAG